MLSVIMPSVIILSVDVLSVDVLNVDVLRIIMLNVVMLSVVMLNVVAPSKRYLCVHFLPLFMPDTLVADWQSCHHHWLVRGN